MRRVFWFMHIPLVAALGCASTGGAVGPQNDAFAGWGAPPPALSAPPQPEGPSAAEVQARWLNGLADWRGFDAERLEAEVFRLTNRWRAGNDLAPLTPSATISSVSRGHSVEMSLVGKLSHTSPIDPRITLEVRLRLGGVSFKALAENVAAEPLVAVQWDSGRQELYTWAEVAANAVNNWAASPTHRENMARKDMKQLGVGAAVVVGEQGPRVYLTQDFVR